MQVFRTSGITDAKSHERRRPNRERVRSERYPAIGSEIASQTRAIA